MRTSIENLLTFSRVTTKARPFVAVDLGSAARDALSDLDTRVAQSGVRVEIGQLPSVDADASAISEFAGQCSQVLSGRRAFHDGSPFLRALFDPSLGL
jgi:light-regulated signal transduction histidine kinase (bacteriophytochrome)